MAGRHSTQVPLPFPSHIDRNAFGHWLSGFTDGEASFTIQTVKKGFTARFSIQIRYDDREVVRLIQSYWQCGSITRRQNKTGSPLSSFVVSSWTPLAEIVIKHFENFPLFAKKKNDFEIWKKAVLMGIEISRRPIRGFGYRNGSPGGTYPRWTEEEKYTFTKIKLLLMEQRKYRD